MKRLVGPRFGVEAAFILAVAAVAFLLELERREILAAMLGAWTLVAVAELAFSRRRPPADAGVEARPVAEAEAELAPPPPTLADLSAPEPERDPAASPDETQPPPPVEVAPPAREPEPEPEPEREPESEPELEPAAAARLEAVPKAEPEPEPVVPLPPPTPREWNLWELERRVREDAGADAAQTERRAYVLLYLREFATPEGTLPRDFDELVRETFGDLLEPTA